MTEPPTIPEPRLIKRDVWCPKCNYNLRGLTGEVVSCPECGRPCDIMQLYAMQQVKGRKHVPGFWEIRQPTVFLFCMAIPGVILTGATWNVPAIGITYGSVLLIAWAYWIADLGRRNGSEASIKALQSAGLSLANFIGPLLTGMLFLLMVRGGVVQALILAVVLAVNVGIVMGCTRGHRSIRQWCLQRWIDGRPIR